MSDCMIIRRGGGGGKGFDPNGAVLKVVTSTGCTVLVTGTGYSKTHQQADGYPRSSDADVTEHFFSIPASAFGTITVKATNTYGDNTKTLTVNTAGKVYELLCGGLNIILDSTFGLQSGYRWVNAGSNIKNASYVERSKAILPDSSIATGYTGGIISPNIPVTAFSTLIVAGTAASAGYRAELTDQDNVTLCTISQDGERTAAITNKYYPTAELRLSVFNSITKIVLS